ncbi:MAG: hypothetical protein K0U64_10115 [Actinomycetia bacterium]|nr:hypothetical protein [Actinomycetes bacterium]
MRRTISGSLAGLLALSTVVAAPGLASAESEDPAPDAAGSVRQQAKKSNKVKATWDWTMPTFMKDKKTFVPTQDPNSPDYFQGGSYIKGPDGITDKPLKQLSRYKAAGNAVYGKFPKNGKFQVKLDASKSSGKGKLKCDWKITADGKTYRRKNLNCAKKKSVKLPEGRHALELQVTDAKGRSETVASHIRVKNVLMAIMGDSYASGVSIPPFTNPDIKTTPRQVGWDFGPCNRSRWGGFVRGAQALESADKRSNVTLVDVACGGAEVREGFIQTLNGKYPSGGILYPQRQIPFDGGAPPTTNQPAQVEQVNGVTRGAALDALYLSVGGNDAGLGTVAVACKIEDGLQGKNCYSEVPFFDATGTQALWQITDANLVRLKKSYTKMSRCLKSSGDSGGKACKTNKLDNNVIADKPTKTTPITVKKNKSVIHAMYPDLTTTKENGALAPCSLTNGESPMNQIDNTWALEQMYLGKSGETITLPTQYSPPLQTPSPATITPQGDGILPLIERNGQRYGWTVADQMYEASRGSGLCAPEPWEYGLATVLNPANNPGNPGAALHPNAIGQQQYAKMLGKQGKKISGIPVSKSSTNVVPDGGLG